MAIKKIKIGSTEHELQTTIANVDGLESALAGKASTSVATTSVNGLMSSSDKTKLDGIATGANKTVVDSSLSGSSTNPVQNKVVASELSKKMGDYCIELYNGTGGNPKPVRFASFNYSTCTSEEGIAAKIGIVSGHGNGSSYAFLEDAIIKVNYQGAVSVDNFKYYGASTGTYDGAERQYGDIFWLVDSTNKIIDFYVLMGQYARMNQTPWKRLTYSSKGTVTQHTSCTVYSSGTKNWANNSEIATKSDIPEGQDLSAYAKKATTLAGYGITDAYTKTDVDTTVASLNSSIDGKATKATTLSGYGITDAYTKTQVESALSGKAGTGIATTSANGLMSSSDKSKLDGIASGANKYVLPVAGTAIGGVKSGTDITVDSSGNVSVNDNSHSHTIANITSLQSTLDAKVPNTRTVNGKALSSNISLSASDVGADVSGSASSALTSAKSYTDTQINKLLDSSNDGVIDSIAELAAAINENDTAIETLNGIAAKKADSSALTSHTGNGDIHVTAAKKTNWDAAYSHSTAAHAPSNAQPNQNAFSNIVVGSTTIAADTTTDSLTVVAGSNITLTPDATNDKLTIAAKDTTYSAATSSAAGLMSASDKAKLDGIASGANNYTYTLPAATSSSLGGVKVGSNITNSSGTISLTKDNVVAALGYTPPTQDTNTTYSEATTSASGLMSAGDKSKLNGIASGAEVNQNAFSNVVIGDSTISADAKTDSLTLAGSNVTLTADATNDKVTIGITKANVVAALGYTPPTQDTNTTYGVVSTTADGLVPKRDGSTTKYLRADGTWAVPPDNDTKYTHPSHTAYAGIPTANQTPSFGGTFNVGQVANDASGHVTSQTSRTVTIPSTLSNGTGTAGLIKTTSSVTSNSGYTACPVINGVPYYKDTDTDTKYTHPASGVTAGTYNKVTVDVNGHVTGGSNPNYAGSSSDGGAATTALACTGNSATATKLATGRTISLTGDVTGSASFDGSGDVSIAATVADNSHNHYQLVNRSFANGAVTILYEDDQGNEFSFVPGTGRGTHNRTYLGCNGNYWGGLYTDFVVSDGNVNTKSLTVSNGGASNLSGSLGVAGDTNLNAALSISGITTASARIQPYASSQVNLGYSDKRWMNIYSNANVNVSSDLNVKTDIVEIDDRYIELFDLVQPYAYKFIDGTSGRVHTGFISQYVEDAMKQVGLTAEELAFFCRDIMTEPVYDEDGNFVEDKELYDEDGNPVYYYSLRYGEYVAIMTEKIKRMEKRIDELETKLDKVDEIEARLATLENA